MQSTDETLEVVKKGNSKVDATEQHILKMGLTNNSSIAVGDYDNDYELLQRCDQPVAPANASLKIRQDNNIYKLDITNDEDLILRIAQIYFNMNEVKLVNSSQKN